MLVRNTLEFITSIISAGVKANYSARFGILVPEINQITATRKLVLNEVKPIVKYGALKTISLFAK